MGFDTDKVLVNVRRAETEDLLQRCTVFRAGMEPEALEIIEAELRSRGIFDDALDAYKHDQCGVLQDRGLPVKCSFCFRGAVAEKWGWHRLWDKVPIIPRKFRYCAEHLPNEDT